MAADLDELEQTRRELGELLRLQEPSVMYFAREDVADDDSAGPGSFFRTVEDCVKNEPPSGSRLTTTVTCLESLLEMPAWQRDPDGAARAAETVQRLESFMGRHLADDDIGAVWKSDGAAWVYCRVRALGSYLRLSNDVAHDDYPHGSKVTDRIREAWKSHYDGGASFGLREATSDVSLETYRQPDQLETTDQQYPPNAYLTYWGLLASRGARRLPGRQEQGGLVPADDDKAAHEWLVENLAKQVAFHYNRSSLADPQQLAWSICGLVRFADGAALDNARSPGHELLVAGLRAFFEQMDENGDWPLGAPLFHYSNAGNAYSYIYELLSELFSLAAAGTSEVSVHASAALRRELRPHWPRIKTMLRRAEHLGQRVENKPDVRVWASGHHPHRSAESWATASVFRFLQSVRRVVGLWCSAEAKIELGSRKPRLGMSDIIERGDTWDTGRGSVGLYLRLAFVWPIERRLATPSGLASDRLFCEDPDSPILATEDQARSAILFGPPGTGKTNLVEAMAGALSWEFIEINPARFIDQGVDMVSARADYIFRRLMQIDRCVVLLDEIDELIQLRGAETDPLERFFTTTMLPRLAKLWELGRILFFVNTNDIERVDTAIRRAQRFDAALFVLPPSYAQKTARLEKLGVRLPITVSDVNRALGIDTDESASRTVDEHTEQNEAQKVNLGWFALMRFDQIGPFGATFAQSTGEAADGAEAERTEPELAEGAMETALTRVAKELLRLDWLTPVQGSDKLGEGTRQLGPQRTADVTQLPDAWHRLLDSERRDDRRALAWRRKSDDDNRYARYEDVPTGTDHPEQWALGAGFEIDEATGQLSKASDIRTSLTAQSSGTSEMADADPSERQ